MSEQRFLTGSREQAFLLPPDMSEWLRPDHLVWAICEAVERLDFSRFEAEYRDDGRGRPAYDPRLMATLLLYACAVGERSSRAIERRCREDVAFRVAACAWGAQIRSCCKSHDSSQWPSLCTPRAPAAASRTYSPSRKPASASSEASCSRCDQANPMASPVAPVFESDRGCAAVALNGFRPRVLRLHADHVEDLLRAMEALHFELAGRLRVDDVLNFGEDAQADQDLPGRCSVPEP
jgi:hypothetical protein